MEDGRPRPSLHEPWFGRGRGRPSSIRLFFMIYNVTIDGTAFRLDLDLDRGAGRWRCLGGGRAAQPDVLSVVIDGKAYQNRRERLASDLRIWVGDRPYTAEVSDLRSLRGRKARADRGKGPRRLVASLAGK